MRGRVRVDLYGAVSEHNALCGEQMPPVREFTDAELDACRAALKDAGVDVQGNPTSESLSTCVAWAVVVAVMVAVTVWILAVLT